MLLICSLFTQRSNRNARSISVGRLRCVHVCLWPPASERTRQRKKQKRKQRVRGGDDSLILTDCQRKIPARTSCFSDFCLFCFDFESCFLPYDEDMLLSSFRNISQTSAWLYCLPSPLFPPPSTAAWSLRAPWWGWTCGPFCYLFCCSFCFFGERSSGGGGEFVASPGLPSARRGENRERGYVPSLSGLLTGLPPFMTTGSVVVLLDGGHPTSLGTASPTSCNEGSRYIATAGEEQRKSRRTAWRETEDICLCIHI